jgi:hypothetical protein
MAYITPYGFTCMTIDDEVDCAPHYIEGGEDMANAEELF